MSADELAMLRAALSQLDGKLDYKVFAGGVGAPNPRAASKRRDYYKKKLFRSVGIGPQPVIPQRTPNSKKSGSPSKKRKLVESDEEADDEEEIRSFRREDDEYFEDFEKFKDSGHVGSDMEEDEEEEKIREEFSDVYRRL